LIKGKINGDEKEFIKKQTNNISNRKRSMKNLSRKQI